MNKITIIQLLNKIANGEELPKKIKFKKEILTLDNSKEFRYRFKSDTFLCWDWYIENRLLNEEAEIIEDVEEDKEIEKIIYIGYGEDENMQYELVSKLNEVIDAVNKLNKK